MAQKSKTQRAKKSAARQARDAAAAAAAAALEAEAAEKGMTVTELVAANEAAAAEEAKKAQKKSLFKKKDETAAAEAPKAKEAEKPKKERFKFLKEVRAEMKRVTWPTKQEVLRWSAVVVVALLFFGIFVYVLDNFVVTPILLGIAGLAG